MVGPALAPLAGGIATEYFTWRHMQYALAVSGLFGFLAIYFLMPETSHPGTRGLDKDREARARNGAALSTWRPKLLNPFKALSLLKSPNVLAVVSSDISSYATSELIKYFYRLLLAPSSF